MSLQFPWQAWAQMQQMIANKPTAADEFAKLGQGIGSVAGDVGKLLQQQKWKQMVSGLANDPNLDPNLKKMLPLALSNPEYGKFMMPALMRGMMKNQGPTLDIGPDGSMTIAGLPLGGAGAPPAPATGGAPSALAPRPATPPATAGIGGVMGPAPGGPPPPPPPGRTRHIPLTGDKAAALLTKPPKSAKTQDPAMESAKLDTERAKANFYRARSGQSDIYGINAIDKNIDPAHAGRTTPIGAAASSVRRAINGLSLLQQPVVTKTALESTMGDIDSILTQASATVEGRRMLASPNFLNNVASFRSFVSASPDKVNVPAGVVNTYRNILTDLGPIAQKYIQTWVKQKWDLFRPRGEQLVGQERYQQELQQVLDNYDINKQLGMAGGAQPAGGQQVGRFLVTVNP